MHGFAINISRQSLPPFLAITPCGIDGVTMSCLESEAGHPITMDEAMRAFAPELQSQFA
jgi:lipoyl(octanoyl) transferase